MTDKTKSEKTPVVITHVDGDDWHWYYVGARLAIEGHESVSSNVLEAILKEADIPFRTAYAFIDGELAEKACHNADTPGEFFRLGLDPADFE